MNKSGSATYRRLIQAGKDLFPEGGMSGLSVRRVCRRAKVNLGMFHYHFKAKNIFARLVIEEMYDQFIRRLRIQAVVAGRRNFRGELVNRLAAVTRVVRDERSIPAAIITDAIRGHQPTLNFLMLNVPWRRHVIGELVSAGMRKGAFRRIPPVIAAFCMHFTTMAPIVIFGMLERGFYRSRYRPLVKWLAPFVISDKAIQYRAEMAVEGLSGGKK